MKQTIMINIDDEVIMKDKEKEDTINNEILNKINKHIYFIIYFDFC